MCEGDVNAGMRFGGGVVAVRAYLGVLASAGDVLEISVMRGVGGVYDMCICLGRGGVGGDRGEWVTRLGLGLTNSGGTWGKWNMCLCFGCDGVCSVGGEWMGVLDQGMGGWGGNMYVCVVSLDYLCWWQVQVYVYCARQIPAHLRNTQCSILLHLIYICFLTCICMWQISQIQTCLRVVVGPGLVSTSPAFMRSIISHPAGPHGRLAQKNMANVTTSPGKFSPPPSANHAEKCATHAVQREQLGQPVNCNCGRHV